MLTIGLTGGIGSGKSTVAKIFESLGVPVYYADDRAKLLMSINNYLIESIKSEFGDEIYNDKNLLQREKLAEIVFADESMLSKLNALVHPEVFKDAECWMLAHSGHVYVLKEAALIFESNSAGNLDYVITVTAPDELRIKRVMDRDGSTRQQVIDRMNKQIDQHEKARRSDFVILNDEKQLLIKQINHIHQTLTKKADN